MLNGDEPLWSEIKVVMDPRNYGNNDDPPPPPPSLPPPPLPLPHPHPHPHPPHHHHLWTLQKETK